MGTATMEPPRGAGGERVAALRGSTPRWWLVLLAAPAAALLLLEVAGITIEVPAEIYVPGHTVLELLIIAVALATFALQWFAGTTRAFLEPRSRLLGASFLGVALLELVHLLVFPGMPGFLGPATIERGIWFWFAGRIWMVAALLAVFWVKPEAHSRFLHRRWLIPGVIGVVVLVVAVELSLPADRTWFYGPQGLTVLKRALEWALAAACLLGATKAARHPRALPGEAPLRKLAIAFLALGLSELCLSAYRHPYDLANMAGHLYLAAAFGFLFEALFVTALLRPYRELDALRAHVEDELVVTIRRLERMREQREDFLRAVSHDLRNPLQVVLLQADRIARAAGDAPALRGPVGAIRFAGRRMERMLRDLTDAARLEVGELRLARERVGLRAFVEHLLEVEQGVLDSGRVRNLVPAELSPLDVDPDRLDRILVNMLGNALKYSEGEVRITAERDGDSVRVSIADTGPGIPPSDLPRLFERYYRGQRHEGEGLGLGLFIVKGLVEAHGGEIEVTSREGEGSIFTLRLPLSADAAGDATERPAAL